MMQRPTQVAGGASVPVGHGASMSPPPTAAGPATLPVPRIKPDVHRPTVEDPGWKVILHNDDVTPFEVVVYALQRAAGVSLEVAEMIAHEAHTQEFAVVKRGLTEEDANIICGGLRRWSRIEGVCPGVNCEALPDDG